MSSGEGFEQRVLVHAPTGRDGALTEEVLAREEIATLACSTIGELCLLLEQGAGAVVLAEEALHSGGAVRELMKVLHRQPAWSEIPLIIFPRHRDSDESLMGLLSALGHVTILERPARIRTLVSVVQTALRTRHRQYQVRDLLAVQAEGDRKKDAFIAMLGHELRNPLSAIRMALELVDERSGVVPPKALGIIARQTTNLSRMVDDLLDVSRALSGKIFLRTEVVDLGRVLRRARSAVEPRVMGRPGRVTLRGPAEHSGVEGDPVRLEQVLVNLLDNAVKYTPPEGDIEVRLTRAGGDYLVRITDEGLGVPKHMLDQIFAAFTQVESSLDRARGGLGLGLPLVRRLVELHGGRIWAESEGEGRGSSFVVRLSAALPPAEAVLELTGPEGPGVEDTRPCRVLLVDDNADLLEMLRLLVSGWGHPAHVATDGSAALQAILDFRPEIAVLDIGLPGLDGYQVAQRVRARLGQRIRLVAMTGYGQPEDRSRALEAGFDRHLVKPVDPAQLLALLTELGAGSKELLPQISNPNSTST